MAENAKIERFKCDILSGQKFIKNVKKWSILLSFWKLEAFGRTVLLDRSFLIGQKLVENAKIQTFKRDIFGEFQAMFLVNFLLFLNFKTFSSAMIY